MGPSKPVMGLYDQPMWDSIARQRMELQYCAQSGQYRYPPSPACPHCLSLDHEWRPVSGHGEILSWVVFHRRYFEDYPPPYNVVAVRLAEGPIIMTNLVGPTPAGSWIGAQVELCYEQHAGRTINRVRLRAATGAQAA